jgi:hypothetical protein
VVNPAQLTLPIGPRPKRSSPRRRIQSRAELGALPLDDRLDWAWKKIKHRKADLDPADRLVLLLIALDAGGDT